MKYKKKKSPLSSLYSTRIIETFKIREPRDFIFHENSFLFSSTRGRESNLRNREKREFLLETRGIDISHNLATKTRQKIR